VIRDGSIRSVAQRARSATATAVRWDDLESPSNQGLLMAFKLLEMAQLRWRHLDGAQLLPLVRAGVNFADGVEVDSAKHVTQSTDNQPLELPGSVENDDSSDDSWRDQLLSLLQIMPPDAFERLAQRILRESGFIKVEVKGKFGDGGIDGIGILQVNLLSFQVFFQCKRYKDSVSAGAIRDFRGAMVGRTDKGLSITTGRFTPDAKREATRDGAPQIELIDGEQLCDLLKNPKLGLKTELVEHVSVLRSPQ
jgi:restriction endonuclease Mrr